MPVSFQVRLYVHLIGTEFDVLDHLLVMLHLAIIDLDCLAKRTRMAACMCSLRASLALRHFSRRFALAE